MKENLNKIKMSLIVILPNTEYSAGLSAETTDIDSFFNVFKQPYSETYRYIKRDTMHRNKDLIVHSQWDLCPQFRTVLTRTVLNWGHAVYLSWKVRNLFHRLTRVDIEDVFRKGILCVSYYIMYLHKIYRIVPAIRYIYLFHDLWIVRNVWK